MKKGKYVFYYSWGCGFVYIKSCNAGQVIYKAEYCKDLMSVSIEDFKTMAKI